MKNIYVGGDSFCSDRYGPYGAATGWPARLADKLNLILTGEGFPGRGFWNVRLNLIDYLKNNNYDNTDLFVFCHTSPDRLLSKNYSRAFIGIGYDPDPMSTAHPPPPNNKEIVEMYDKYLYEQDIHDWAMKRWFSELNTILNGKPVVHMFCFQQSEKLSHSLNGFKLNSNLHIRARDIGINDNIADYVSVPIGPEYPNHFPVSTNIKIADELANYYLNEISLNPTQTKYFDIDFYNK